MSISIAPEVAQQEIQQLCDIHAQRSLIKSQMIHELRAEVDRLSAENAGLREQLGIDPAGDIEEVEIPRTDEGEAA